MNIVTKSGTNDFHGSWFTSTSATTTLNAKTKTEKIEQPRRSRTTSRYQYGGSFGGPIVQNKAHFFAAYERTQQDTMQSVNTLGLFPSSDGVFADAEPREPVHRQGVGEPDAGAVPVGPLRPQHQLAGLRRDDAPRARQLGRQREHVQLVQRQPQLGARRREAERVRVPVRRLRATTSRRAPATPQQTFPNGVTIGYNTNTPQTTEQRKFQFRDDFSWQHDRHGRPRPRLQGRRQLHPRAAPLRDVLVGQHRLRLHAPDQRPRTVRSAPSRRNKPGASANLPMDQFALYIQDDWRVNDRLTVNAGLRYDLVTGFDIDQSGIPNYIDADQAAAAAGRFNGVPGFEEFGKSRRRGQQQHPAARRRRLRPSRRRQGRHPRRLGHLLRLRLHQRQHPVPGPQRPGRIGRHLHSATNTAGIRNPDGSFFARRPADRQHRERRTRSTRTGRSTARNVTRRRQSASRGRARPRSAGRTS